jgi:U-box domain/FHA domain
MSATGAKETETNAVGELADNTSALYLKPNRLRGMKIRDEFLCPITYELLREPVVAKDGHTYEKAAIEKWLKSHRNSPRSGEAMEDGIIPNMNMKKLIQDLINEGGAGLYATDSLDKDRVIDVYAEKVLILKCLGPPESDWNGQSYQVTRYGCIGGRRRSNTEEKDNLPPRQIMLFRDSTVSRKHFEIAPAPGIQGKYAIRDLGSAGGTFIRINYKQKKQLHAGESRCFLSSVAVPHISCLTM